MLPHSPSGLSSPSRTAFAVSLTLALSALASCSPSPKAGGGIGGTGSVSPPSVSLGSVTKLDGFEVSGKPYDASNALYCIDGEPCVKENTLKLGMVVLTKGRASSTLQGLTNSIADTISFQETVEGVVQAIASDGSSLIVLGQVVVLNQKTVIDEGIPVQSILNLRPGIDAIEVSGFVTGDGHILATLITNRTGNPAFEVEGIIKNHDAIGKRFEIGQLMVAYSAADVSDLTDNGTMNWNNRLVHVRGNEWQPRSELPHGATLSATRVSELGLTVQHSAEAIIEGFITAVTQKGQFVINNHPINVSSGTVFVNGTANELAKGAHVSIVGTLVDGVLQANNVIFKENLRIESDIETIDPQSLSLTLIGFPGLSFETGTDTLIRGESSITRFEDLRVGDHLKIHGKLLEGQRVFATELERTVASAAIFLEAALQSAVDPLITLAGISVDTVGISESEFWGSYGPIGRKIFFDRALVQQPTWVKGIFIGSNVTWTIVGIRG